MLGATSGRAVAQDAGVGGGAVDEAPAEVTPLVETRSAEAAPPGETAPVVPQASGPTSVPVAPPPASAQWPQSFRESFAYQPSTEEPFLGTGWSDDVVVFAGAGLAAEFGDAVVAALTDGFGEGSLVGVGPALHAGVRYPLSRAFELIAGVGFEWYSVQDYRRPIRPRISHEDYEGLSKWLLRVGFGALLRPGDSRFYTGVIVGAGYAAVSGTRTVVGTTVDEPVQELSGELVQLQANIALGVMLGSALDWELGIRLGPTASLDGQAGGSAEILLNVPLVRL